MMFKIAFWVDNNERFNFFKRFLNSSTVNNFHPIFFFVKPSFILSCKIHNIDYVYVRKQNLSIKHKLKYFNFDKNEMENNLDFIQGVLSENSIKALSISIQSSIYDYLNDNTIDYFFVWNGTRTPGRAIKILSQKCNFKTCFMELSNLPGRIFVDSKGVNAESFLYEYLASGESLVNLVCNKEICKNETWKEEYFNYKNKPLPQITHAKKLDLGFIINYLSSLIGFSVLENDLSLLNRIRNKFDIIRGLNKSIGCIANLDRREYVFLPLQVTTDSQIKINSDFDNLDAIDFSINYAKKRGLKLYIKAHPSEMDLSFLNKIEELSKNGERFLIVKNNTVDLVVHADSVIVINSTVGLEAMILGQNVEVLGRALYYFISKDEMPLYINGYLINGIEYFSNDDVEIICFEKILHTIDLQYNFL